MRHTQAAKAALSLLWLVDRADIITTSFPIQQTRSYYPTFYAGTQAPRYAAYSCPKCHTLHIGRAPQLDHTDRTYDYVYMPMREFSDARKLKVSRFSWGLAVYLDPKEIVYFLSTDNTLFYLVSPLLCACEIGVG